MIEAGDGHTWYADPQEPGAPQVGDVVVAVGRWPYEQHMAWVGQIMGIREWSGNGAIHQWYVDSDERHGRCSAHHIRRPTEAELATYAPEGPQAPAGIQWPPGSQGSP